MKPNKPRQKQPVDPPGTSTPNPSTLLAEEAVLLAELVLLFTRLALFASLCDGGGGGGGQARPSRLPAEGGCDGGCEV